MTTNTNTTVLTASGLADLINNTVELAHKPEIRSHDIGDREVYGQLILLENLADFLSIGGTRLTAEEEAALDRARNASDEARASLAVSACL